MTALGCLIWSAGAVICGAMGYAFGRWHQYVIQSDLDAFGGPE